MMNGPFGANLSAPAAGAMAASAPAKINLHLRVGPRRADGFHPLWSWMSTVGLFDTLAFERARRTGVALSIDLDGLPADRGNLVVRAAEDFAEALAAGLREEQVTAGRETTVGGVEVKLGKRIPIGAGLGGGSSDAARTLLILNRLWGADWPRERLAAWSARLGSDVPFFFFAPSAICGGRGEVVAPVARPRPRWAVLALPRWGLSTAAVYRRFDELGRDASDDEVLYGGAPGVSPLPGVVAEWRKWADFPAIRLLERLRNDLEPAAFALSPELGRLRAELEQAAGRTVRMSGSGSSLFTLADAEEEAQHVRSAWDRFGDLQAKAVELAPAEPGDG